MTMIISYNEALKLGLKSYFTGVACRNGHIARRITANRTCVVCASERHCIWRQQNGSRIAQRRKEYRRINADKIRFNKAIWYGRNAVRERAKRSVRYFEDRDRQRKLRRMHYLANVIRYKERAAFYYQANREAKKEYQRLWERNNQDRVRNYKRNGKAKRKKSEGSHTVRDIREIFEQQNGRCAYCRTHLGKRWHVDHIVAIANGGRNDRSNLQVLCEKCNLKKGKSDPIRFAQSLGMLL